MIAETGLAVAALGTLGHFGPAVAGVPGLLPRCSPSVAGRGRPDHIALTFDDGPHPDGTPAILDVLADHEVAATFFLIAEALERHPDLGQRIADDGHEIAVHGWNHRPLPAVPPWSTLSAVRRARDVIAEITSATPSWFRPPYGVATGAALAAAARCGLRPVWWTRWGRDWSAKATPEQVAGAVLGNATGGETVLLHDSDTYGTAGVVARHRRLAARDPRRLCGTRLAGRTVGRAWHRYPECWPGDGWRVACGHRGSSTWQWPC